MLEFVMDQSEASNPHQITSLLLRWRGGDKQAGDRLLDVTYKELRRLAAAYMRNERSGHTLQPTVLVHELYMRLFSAGSVQWENRAHFFALAARQLRRILVNHARDRQAAKRGGRQVRLSFSDLTGVNASGSEDTLAIDEALCRLERMDSRAAQVVELRFFGGLTEAEAAEALGISVATVKRDWNFARAWLIQQLGSAPVQRRQYSE
jgi:RNA polymerase sigma factor (TIGR02999 family)